ncbi:MAG: CoA transferase, partial [Pseudomonadota bacterium]
KQKEVGVKYDGGNLGASAAVFSTDQPNFFIVNQTYGPNGEQRNRGSWDHARATLTRIFKTRTREAWCALLEGSDACFAPVLDMAEAPQHAHLKARDTFIEIDGVVQPAVAPRFSRTVPDTPTAPETPDAARALADWLSPQAIADLKANGVV